MAFTLYMIMSLLLEVTNAFSVGNMIFEYDIEVDRVMQIKTEVEKVVLSMIFKQQTLTK